MKSIKKDKEYMAILDKPIEELKKPLGQSIDFNLAVAQILKHSKTKSKENKYGQQL